MGRESASTQELVLVRVSALDVAEPSAQELVSEAAAPETLARVSRFRER